MAAILYPKEPSSDIGIHGLPDSQLPNHGWNPHIDGLWTGPIPESKSEVDSWEAPRTTHFGGYTAGPAFARIAEYLATLHPELLRYPEPTGSREMPRDLPDPSLRPGEVPNLQGLPLARAAACLARLGFEAHVRGTGTVSRQFPAAGSPLRSGGKVDLFAIPPDESSRRSS